MGRLSRVPYPVAIRRSFRSILLGAGVFSLATARADEKAATVTFHKEIEPLLEKYCGDCHFGGLEKGDVAFDEFTSDADLLGHRELWVKALRNVRAGLMPPKEDGDEALRPKPDEIERLARWIKFGALGIDPANPDPGRVTVRRLNRVEYHNTIRDLMGIDFNAEAEFPPDDSGNGFDNNGDVLTISPLLLEKYLAAAETITDRAVPKVSRVMRERIATAKDFRTEDGRAVELLSVKKPAKVSKTFTVDETEIYQFGVDLEVRGSFDFDPNRCKVICRIDGAERFAQDIVWSERKNHHFDYEVKWTAGDHVVEFEIAPMAPVAAPPKPQRRPVTEPEPSEAVAANATAKEGAPAVRPARQRSGGILADGAGPAVDAAVAAAPASLRRASVAAATAARLDVRIASVQVNGPIDRKFWVAPENHARFFPDGAAPEDPVARDQYASKVLRHFATRAFRRPVDDAKVNQLAAIARATYTQPDKSFEEGIARAMMAVLASPRFLFRVEEPVPGTERQAIAPIDEYALASRLSYFLWSTMPDDELFEAAARGDLRTNLHAQVDRMLKDSRAQAFVRDFTGQWLQARDIEFVPINARAVLGITMRRGAGAANSPRIDFDGPIRKLMRSETEMYFDHVVRDDRSVLELIDSDYTFLNARLAAHYGVPGVTGDTLHLVQLPPDSPRGGVLTQGTVLAVTSNPTRTSPVKRGLFILENILGTPTPPPPPNVPDLEDSKKEIDGREPKLSEVLALHRESKLCSSCHSRMDPLGLALENFNAMGMWRDTEAKQPIDAAGQLITGEKFTNVRELKHVLATERKMDYYRCLTEKMLIYALGRGLEPTDIDTVDVIVDRLDREGGKMSALIYGIIESAPFQKQRMASAASTAATERASTLPASLARSESQP